MSEKTMSEKISSEKISILKQRATKLALLASTLQVIVKLTAWVFTGSIGVLTVAIDSLADMVMSLVNFLAVRKGSKPADKNHRFGFGKYESLAGLIQSTFLFGMAVIIMFEGVDRLFHPHQIVNMEWGIGAMIISLILIAAVVLYQQYVIRLTNSIVVRADSLHYKSDIMMNGAIIISLLLSEKAGIPWIDSVFAILIALYLLWGAKGIFIEALNALMDTEFPDEIRRNIRDIALSDPDVLGVHDLRTRSCGDNKFIQLHIEMDPDINLSKAHQTTERVIDCILEVHEGAEVQIHEEPVGMPRHRSWCHKKETIYTKNQGEYSGIYP
jgi:ferrous-iron efflux pump FieF